MTSFKYKDLDEYLMVLKEASHDSHALPSVGCAFAAARELAEKPATDPVIPVLNNHLPICADCTRKHLKFCSFFEDKQTCDRKKYLDKKQAAAEDTGSIPAVYKLIFSKAGVPYAETLFRETSLATAVAEANKLAGTTKDVSWLLYFGKDIVSTSAPWVDKQAVPVLKQYWAAIERPGLFPVLLPIDAKDSVAAEIELYRRCQKESAYLTAAVLADSVGNVLHNLTRSCIESGVAALPKPKTYSLYSFPPEQVAEKYSIQACSDDEALGKVQATLKERGQKAQHWRLVCDSDHTQVAASWRG